MELWTLAVPLDSRMKIVQYPHPALRHVCRPLTAIDAKVRKAAEEMLEAMYAAKGLGLAAPQVALPYRLIVLNLTGDRNQRDQEGVYVNPVILEKKGSVEDEEGCLSFPGLYAKIRRAKSVNVQAYNLSGEAVGISATELAARAWQHEIDHLDGILFIDKMGTIAKLASRGSLKEFEREYRRSQDRGELAADAELTKAMAALDTGG
jgi:peptide deformylase